MVTKPQLTSQGILQGKGNVSVGLAGLDLGSGLLAKYHLIFSFGW